MPVTHGVRGSSPLRTAEFDGTKQQSLVNESFIRLSCFYTYARKSCLKQIGRGLFGAPGIVRNGFERRGRKPKTCVTFPCWRKLERFWTATKNIPIVRRTACFSPCAAQYKRQIKTTDTTRKAGLKLTPRRRAVYEAIWNCAMHRSKSS